MNPYGKNYEMDFEKTVPKVSPINFEETMSLYKNSSYSEYIFESLQISNLKWVYPSISLILVMELLTSQNYLIDLFSQNELLKYIFIGLLLGYLILGYFFVVINDEENSNRKVFVDKINGNVLVISTLILFIILQLYFYYTGIMTNQSFFYYISVVVAMATFTALPTSQMVFLMLLNYMLFVAVSLTKLNYTSFFSVCLNSFYVTGIGILLSFYFFTSKIISLVNSKKVSVFAKQMASANDELNYLNDELEKLSFTDSLTKIGNRRSYDLYGEKIWNQGMRSKSHVAFLLVDIDNFKEYNDYFGHAQGDECLYEVAQAIASCFKRTSDLVTRVGGEEFLVVLPSIDTSSAVIMANKVLNHIRELKIENPKSPVSKYVTVSIGIISIVPAKDISMEMAFSFADKALYAAKNSGRNKYCVDENLSKDNEEITINNSVGLIKNKNDNSIISLTSICFFSINYKTQVFESSKELYDLFGLNKNDIKSLDDLGKHIYYKDRNVFELFKKHLFTSNFKEVNIEFRIIEKTKKIIWVNFLCYLTYNDFNKPETIVGTLRNIDEETKNKDLINDLLDGNYIYDLKTDTGILKGDILNDLDISAENAIFDFNNWYKSIYVKDKNIFNAFIKKAKNINNVNQVINISYRVRLKDKRLVWFSTRNKIYRDVDGTPSVVNGTIMNMEKNLKTLNEKSVSVNSVSGLPDRKQFYKDFSKILKNKNLYGCIIFIDIDNFSNVNKIFGYSIGNEFLMKFNKLLYEKLAFSGKVYHFEGDVFAIISPSLSEEEAFIQMKSIKNITNKPMMLNDVNYDYTLSISSVEYPKFGKNVDDILRNNDIAIQKIKSSGKNNSIQFSQNLYIKNCFELELEKELRKSIDNNMENFELFYQPLILAKTNECIGAEALLRWRKTDNEMIMPNTFIPILEKTGLMIKVGQWVFREAANQCKEWILKNRLDKDDTNKLNVYNNFSMNINISALQMVGEDFETQILSCLHNIDLSGHHITIELTEQILIQDIEKTTKTLNALRDRGIKVAIDDFGTGYSSLSYIRQLPIDEVKIDKSFVKNIENDAFSQQFVNSIINIAKTIDKYVCVEGVEKKVQFEILKDYGADLLQGYYYSRPIPKEEFEKKFLT